MKEEEETENASKCRERRKKRTQQDTRKKAHEKARKKETQERYPRKKTQKMGVQGNMEEKDDVMHAIALDESATEMAPRNGRKWQRKEPPVAKSNILQFSSYVNEEKERRKKR